MESKILNFPDAMKLARVLDKYDLNYEQSASGLVIQLLQRISQEDFSSIMLLLFGENPSVVGNMEIDTINTLELVFLINQIPKLVMTLRESNYG